VVCVLGFMIELAISALRDLINLFCFSESFT
jgi:hypothetical protein